ncbi:MAG: hypothetical protein LH606_08205 [Cytophagaceae bacterium]|nr:hypothetical protein [Cytophagaceae bacterium]
MARISPKISVVLGLHLLLFGPAQAQFLPNQIRIDPQNSSYLVYNRDQDKNGRLDPFFAIGPGEPEGFLYLGTRRADGTRDGRRQTELISRMKQQGGNTLYFQLVRSHGGDGEPDDNPWNDPANPASGINPKAIAQWKVWFDQIRDAGVVLFLFVYDDGTHPFDDGGCASNGTVSDAETGFVRQMANEFKAYPNLVWVVQEEYRFIKAKKSDANTTPCNNARANRARNLAALIKQTDEHQHPVGVHHNIGLPMQFTGDKAVDVYVQQAQVTKTGMHLDTLHAQGLMGFDPRHRYAYVMGEAYDWHRKLLIANDRTMLRKSYYASAMAGGGVMVLAMFDGKTPDPSDEMLTDMRRMQTFFESIPFNDLAPNDALRQGNTRWILAAPEKGHYLLYSPDNPAMLGVRALRAGTYSLTWFDPATGVRKTGAKVTAAGDTQFPKPAGMGAEVVLFLTKN